MEASIINNNKLNIEDQFILRLPQQLADKLREKLQDDDLDGVSVTFGTIHNIQTRPNVEISCNAFYVCYGCHSLIDPGTDPKRGKFCIDGGDYEATLANLPCVVETHKTLNNKTFFKSGDVGQIIVVEDPEADEEVEFGPGPESLTGLAPASHNIRKRNFSKARKPHDFTKVQVREAEEELTRRKDGHNDSLDTHYEQIQVKDVLAIYQNTKGQAIVIKKKGNPVLIGAERPWTDAELEGLPERDRKLVKQLQSRTNYDDDEDDEEEEDKMEEVTKMAPPPPPAQPVKETKPESLAPSQTDVTQIRRLRRKKIEIANDVKRLRDSIKEKRLMMKNEQNELMKHNLKVECDQELSAIHDKRQESLLLDEKLKSFGAV